MIDSRPKLRFDDESNARYLRLYFYTPHYVIPVEQFGDYKSNELAKKLAIQQLKLKIIKDIMEMELENG